MDYSLYGLLNHFLFIGLGFFLALLISKKKKLVKLKTSPPVQGADGTLYVDTTKSKKGSFIRNRIIRLIFLIAYLVVFFVFFRYKKFHYTQIITLAVAFLLFFAYFRLKVLLGAFFVLLIAGIIVLVVMLQRSMYLLFHEEVIGRIKITQITDNSITMRIEEIDTNLVKKVHKVVRVEGKQFGVYCYQMYYKKWLLFFGFENRFLWSGVLGIKFQNIQNGRTKAKMDIYLLDPNNFAKKDKIWQSLEKKELFLPGIRNVQRLIVFKNPVQGTVYRLIKHRTGQITLEIKESQ